MYHDMYYWHGMYSFGAVPILSGLVFFGIAIWLHWRILEKMGYDGMWSLLLLLGLVPMLNLLAGLGYLVALWVLAFTAWPRDYAPDGGGPDH